MPLEQRRVRPREGKRFLPPCVLAHLCSGLKPLCILQLRNGKQHLVRVRLLSSARMPVQQQVSHSCTALQHLSF